MISNDIIDVITGSGGGCFLADTQVLTPEGNISIQDIKVGDPVLCYDAYGSLFISKVLNTNSHLYKDVYEYTLWGGSTINATPNHWVLNSENSFSEIGKITESLCLVSTVGTLLPIVSKKYLGKFKVYNLIVDVYHTYIANNIRVHNGGGGKSGSGTAPTEAADTLKSISYAKVLDLLCEGEIEGLVDGAKSIYFNDSRLQNLDGSFSYEGVTWDARNGTQDQTPIDMFDSIEAETAVQVEVTNENPFNFTIYDNIVDKVRIGLAIGQLMEQKSTGDLVGATVTGRITCFRNNEQISAEDFTVTGKTTSKYVFNKTIELPKVSTSDEFDIVVSRVSAASNLSSYKNDFYIESYTKIVSSKLKYPNSALVGIKVNSANFSSIPTRGYHVKLLKIRIPTNYNPITRLYNRTPDGTFTTGVNGIPIEQIWDGTFYTAWSNNPAWCLYDLITSSRYGLGDYIDAKYVDKWSLYTIARYCDALVSDGLGGIEHRFTLNAYIQTRDDAIKVLNNISSAFRGMLYWSSGLITAVQDAGGIDPVMQFNNSNVIDGNFEYSSASNKVVHNAAIVTWNDPQLNYRQRLEYVEDREGIERYGYNPAEFIAFGTTSRGQAHRAGKWLLYTEKVESSVVAFKAALDASYLRPGLIIKVQDDLRAGNNKYIRGGRIIELIDNNTIRLDRPVTLNSLDTYGIRITNFKLVSNTYSITNTTNTKIVSTSTDIAKSLLFKDTTWELRDSSNVVVAKGLVHLFSTTKLIELDKEVVIAGAGYSIRLERAITNTKLFSISNKDETTSILNTILPINTPLNTTVDSNGITIDSPTLTIDGSLTTDIGTNSLWTLTTSSVTEELYKVISVKETTDLGVYDILGVRHDPNKFGYVEDNEDLLDPSEYTTLSNKAEAVNPASITLIDSIYLNSAGQVQTLLSIGFTPSLYATSYSLLMKKGDDAWIPLVNKSMFTEHTQYNVIDNEYYRFKIIPHSLLGGDGPYTIYPPLSEPGKLVLGKLRPPNDVKNLVVFNQGEYVRLDWDPVSDLDLKNYRVKVGNVSDTWETASLVANVNADVFDAIPSIYSTSYLVIKVDSVEVKADSVLITTSGVARSGAAVVLATSTTISTDSNIIDASGGISKISTIRYFVKAIDTTENESVSATYVDFKIDKPGKPIVTSTIIGNTVELRWQSAKTTLNIVSYNIYQGTTNNLVANVPASSYTKYINWVGNTSFFIEAIDIAGNRSIASDPCIINIVMPSFTKPMVFSVQDTNLRIDWEALQGTLSIKEVEIKFGGSSWEIGSTKVAKTTGSYTTIPITWVAGRIFRLKIVDIAGNYSTELTSIFTVQVPSAPLIQDLLFSKSDDSVRLSWFTSKTTLPIDFYEIREGVSWPTATPLGKIYALESTLPVNWLDNDGVYLIRATDVLGNEGSISQVVATIVKYGPISGASYTYNNNQVIIKWSPPLVSGSLSLSHYEVWDGSELAIGAKVLDTFTTEAQIPVDWSINKGFWIIPVDSKGYKGTATYTIVTVAGHTQVNNLVSIIRNNNIELTWAESTEGSLPIKYYLISTGVLGPEVEIAKTSSTSFIYSIDFIGSTKLWVTPVDTNPISAYSYGIPNSTSLISIPKAPPPIIDTASIVGTKVALSWHNAVHLLPISSYTVYINGVEYTTLNSTSLRVPIPINTLGTLDISIIAIDSNLINDHSNISEAATTSITINAPDAPIINTLTSGFSTENYIIHWGEVSNDIPIEDYEIGYGITVLARQKTNTFSATAQWLGNRTFWVRAIDVLGNKGQVGEITLEVKTPTSVSNFTSKVVDNNILLYWGNVISTLPIHTYEIRQGPTWQGYTKLIGTKNGNFTSLFETEAGTYTYWIAAIDSAGNIGVPRNVTSEVNQPPDYVLKANDYANFNSISATLINAVVDTNNNLVIPVNPTDTWSQHFTSRNWTSPDNQVTAGFPTYIQPSVIDGYFEDTINYGTLLSSIKVSIEASYQTFSGIPSISCDIYTSSTGIAGSWTLHQDTWTTLAENFQFIKYRITVTSAKSATYTQSGNTIVVHIVNHGLISGESIFADFIDGSAANIDDGVYTITYIDNSNFSISSSVSRSIVTPANLIVHVSGNSGVLNISSINIKLDSKLRTFTGNTKCRVPIMGTYTQSGTSIQVNSSNHGILANEIVDLDFLTGTSGTAIDGAFKVDSALANSFICTATNNINTTGNVIVDNGGTLVPLTKNRLPIGIAEFIDVDAVSITANSTVPVIPVYDLLDQPNPKYFKVLLFDTLGDRAAGTCSYTVRGF